MLLYCGAQTQFDSNLLVSINNLIIMEQLLIELAPVRAHGGTRGHRRAHGGTRGHMRAHGGTGGHMWAHVGTGGHMRAHVGTWMPHKS